MVEKIIISILRKVVGLSSTEVKNQIATFYKNLKASADKTENEWDDLFVLILGVLLGIED